MTDDVLKKLWSDLTTCEQCECQNVIVICEERKLSNITTSGTERGGYFGDQAWEYGAGQEISTVYVYVKAVRQCPKCKKEEELLKVCVRRNQY